MHKAYYNEIEPSAITWLKAAMDAGHIIQGDIDTRPIQEVKPDDLRGYTQHHFFAGIGGWSIALRLAGWPDERPVWTGSCPCQPFSSAGRQKGKTDERHLWPIWFRLIRESAPATIFGEQVANAITKGWLDDVYDDMESESYAVASAVLPACSVGAPHKRDRLWFVADSDKRFSNESPKEICAGRNPSDSNDIMGNAEHNGQLAATEPGGDREAIQHDAQGQDRASKSERAGTSGNVPDSKLSRLERHRQSGHLNGEKGRETPSRHFAEDSLDWISFPDGKARPVKSGLCLLADGIPGKLRKAALHGFGNAIVPQVAAEFIGAYMEIN